MKATTPTHPRPRRIGRAVAVLLAVGSLGAVAFGPAAPALARPYPDGGASGGRASVLSDRRVAGIEGRMAGLEGHRAPSMSLWPAPDGVVPVLPNAASASAPRTASGDHTGGAASNAQVRTVDVRVDPDQDVAAAGRGRAARASRSVADAVRAELDEATGAAVSDFEIVNAASFEATSRPRGGLLSVFTDAPVSDEDQTFPGVEATPAGVSLEVSNCTLGGPPRRLRIFSVGPAFGGSQINVYFPNDVGEEPYGTCTSPPVSAVFANFTLRTADGQAVTKRLTSNPVFPGMFAYSSPLPAHYETATGRYTSVPECDADPRRCPVSTGGQRNFLVVWTTGGELRSCNTACFGACDSPLAPRFRLTAVADDGGAAAAAVDQELTYYGPDGSRAIGVDQANVRLAPGTGAGTYDLTMALPDLPSVSPQQRIQVRLGPPA